MLVWSLTLYLIDEPMALLYSNLHHYTDITEAQRKYSPEAIFMMKGDEFALFYALFARLMPVQYGSLRLRRNRPENSAITAALPARS